MEGDPRLHFTGEVRKASDPEAEVKRLRHLLATLQRDSGRAGVMVSVDPSNLRVVVSAGVEDDAMSQAARLGTLTLDAISWALAIAARDLLTGTPLWERIATDAEGWFRRVAAPQIEDTGTTVSVEPATSGVGTRCGYPDRDGYAKNEKTPDESVV